MLQFFKRGLKRLLRFPSNVIVRSSTAVPQSFVSAVSEAFTREALASPVIAGKFYPIDATEGSYSIPARLNPGDAAAPTLPVPPRELWDGLASTDALFLSHGQRHVQKMRQILAAAAFTFEPGGRVLDFGCSAGMMIRWLDDVAQRCEVWGVDISAPQVSWCQEHLSPPFRFATTTTVPHLPFEDRHFDLIYAGSVFTHIADLADAWLLELRRLLRPGGKLYVTVGDNHSVDLLLGPLAGDCEWLVQMLKPMIGRHGQLGRDVAMFVAARSPKGAQVFYDIDYLCQRWGRYMKVLSVTREAYGSPMFQTALLLEKDSA